MIIPWRLPRQSREWVGPITVTADGAPVDGWTYAILPWGSTPGPTGEDIDGEPVTLDDERGILVGPETEHELVPGRYRIWVRYVSGQEAPVLDAVGVLVIT